MGNLLLKSWFKKDFAILFMGLNATGKKTIIYDLYKFSIETRVQKQAHFTAWDMGGRMQCRPFYLHYFQNIDALVYVIDSNDRDRLEQAIDRLAKYIDEDELRDTPIAIMANKQDLPNAMEPTEIYKKICENRSMRLRDWTVFSVSGLTGDGLLDCMDWLYREVNKFKCLRSTTEPVQEVFDLQKQEDANNNVTEDSIHISKDVSKLSFFKSVLRSFGEKFCSK